MTHGWGSPGPQRSVRSVGKGKSGGGRGWRAGEGKGSGERDGARGGAWKALVGYGEKQDGVRPWPALVGTHRVEARLW